MPEVLCGLACFDAPSLSTAGDAAREFLASLDPALQSPGCAVEVYRLERVPPEAALARDDLVVCCLPGWRFDFAAVEELHRQFEELRSEQETLQLQYSRTKEALISLNTSLEAADAQPQGASEVAPSEGARRRDKAVQGNVEAQLRQQLLEMRDQLTEKDKKHQETKATVVALRTEFMQLVQMMQFSGCQYQGLEIPSVMKELDNSTKTTSWAPETARSPNNAGDGAAPRQVSQPPPGATTIVAGVRRPAGSPQAVTRASPTGSDVSTCDTFRMYHRGAPAPPVTFATPRMYHRGAPAPPVTFATPRVVPASNRQRGIAHSAGAPMVRRPDAGM